MASIGSSVSANDGFFEALKKMYSPEKTRLRVELNHPTFRDIKKVAIGEGQNYTYAIGLTYGSGFGNSLSGILASTSTAGNPSSGAKLANIVANTGDDYAVLNLHNKFLKRSAKADASFVEQLKWQVDSSLKGMGLVLSQKLFGDGTGKLGAITSTSTAGAKTSITLTDAKLTKFLTVGMYVQVGTISGTTVTLDGTGFGPITAINESSGEVTVSFTTANANNVYVGLYGIFGASTNASGFESWLPLTVGTTAIGPLVISNVSRADYASHLAGFRVDDTTRPIDECAYLLAQKIQERGGRPDRIVCSYNTFNKMAVKAWNKIVPMNKAEASSTGVASLGLVTPEGTIPFVVDSSCPDNRCYMLTMDTWRLIHLSGALPERITDAASAGQMFQTLEDSVQIRYRAWWNLVCLSPVDNGVFSVDSTNF